MLLFLDILGVAQFSHRPTSPHLPLIHGPTSLRCGLVHGKYSGTIVIHVVNL